MIHTIHIEFSKILHNQSGTGLCNKMYQRWGQLFSAFKSRKVVKLQVQVKVRSRSFEYFEKIPILGKCLSLILSPLKITSLQYFQILMSYVPCLMSSVKSPMSNWSWRSWQFPVYWSLTLKQLHLVHFRMKIFMWKYDPTNVLSALPSVTLVTFLIIRVKVY